MMKMIVTMTMIPFTRCQMMMMMTKMMTMTMMMMTMMTMPMTPIPFTTGVYFVTNYLGHVGVPGQS